MRLDLQDDVLKESGDVEEAGIGSGIDEEWDNSRDGGDVEIAEVKSSQQPAERVPYVNVADQFGTLEALATKGSIAAGVR